MRAMAACQPGAPLAGVGARVGAGAGAGEPGVTGVRVRRARTRASAGRRGRRVDFPPAGERRAAFFDVDGTLLKSNVVMPYVFLKLAEMPLLHRLLWVPYFALKAVAYKVLDRLDRALFQRVFYASYKGRHASFKRPFAEYVHREYFAPRVRPAARAEMERLREAGYVLVLVTGSLDFLARPLAVALGVDVMIAASLEEDEDARLTGKILGAPVSDKEKAKRMLQLAEEKVSVHSCGTRCARSRTHTPAMAVLCWSPTDNALHARALGMRAPRGGLAQGIVMEESVAYGDGFADLEMLEAVGEAVAVNADARLGAIARERGWRCEQWAEPEDRRDDGLLRRIFSLRRYGSDELTVAQAT